MFGEGEPGEPSHGSSEEGLDKEAETALEEQARAIREKLGPKDLELLRDLLTAHRIATEEPPDPEEDMGINAIPADVRKRLLSIIHGDREDKKESESET